MGQKDEQVCCPNCGSAEVITAYECNPDTFKEEKKLKDTCKNCGQIF